MHCYTVGSHLRCTLTMGHMSSLLFISIAGAAAGISLVFATQCMHQPGRLSRKANDVNMLHTICKLLLYRFYRQWQVRNADQHSSICSGQTAITDHNK